MSHFVAYYRVSTQKQGASGLGLEAQRAAVLAHVGQGTIIEEFTEIESGKRADRPKLREAMKLAKRKKATLIIAKLDRLSRNVHFISGLMESKVEFIACDMPSANKLTIHLMAAIAEHEREMISARTKAALAAAKARGVVLGRDSDGLAQSRSVWTEQANQRKASVRQIIEAIQASGITTLKGVAGALNTRGIKTTRGNEWTATQVSRVLCSN